MSVNIYYLIETIYNVDYTYRRMLLMIGDKQELESYKRSFPKNRQLYMKIEQTLKMKRMRV